MPNRPTYKYRPSAKAVDTADWKAVDHNLKYAQVTGTYTDLQMAFCLPDDWTPPTGTATDVSAQPLSTGCAETKCSDPTQVYQPYVQELGWDKALHCETQSVGKLHLKWRNPKKVIIKVVIEKSLFAGGNFLQRFP